MRITGCTNSLPMNIAKAYGVKRSSASKPANDTSPIASIGSNNPGPRPDAYRSGVAANQLVAGKVSQSVNFNGPSTVRSSLNAAPVLPMYTRAADKMEAAVAVQIGRTLDVLG